MELKKYVVGDEISLTTKEGKSIKGEIVYLNDITNMFGIGEDGYVLNQFQKVSIKGTGNNLYLEVTI